MVTVLGGFASAQQRSTCSGERVARETKASEFVVIASVKKVLSPPGYWSGLLAAMQLVEYSVVESLKGKLDQSPIVVSHCVVANSLTTDAKVPQLSPDLFKPGRTVIVFLDSGAGQFWRGTSDPQPTYTVKDENCGVIAADSDLGRAVRAMLKRGN